VHLVRLHRLRQLYYYGVDSGNTGGEIRALTAIHGDDIYIATVLRRNRRVTLSGQRHHAFTTSSILETFQSIWTCSLNKFYWPMHNFLSKIGQSSSRGKEPGLPSRTWRDLSPLLFIFRSRRCVRLVGGRQKVPNSWSSKCNWPDCSGGCPLTLRAQTPQITQREVFAG